MILVALLLLALRWESTIASGGGDKEHVHFKIYVPEIINHHIHTRTVFIHVHEPKKEPKKEHVGSRHEKWNSWSSYNDYNEHSDRHDSGNRLPLNDHAGKPVQIVNQHHLQGHHGQGQGYVTPYAGLIASPGSPSRPVDSVYPSLYREHPEPPIPHYDDFQPNYQSMDDHRLRYYHLHHPAPINNNVFHNGATGYSHPPQYEVRENVVEDVVEDLPESSLENLKNMHEDRHSERLHSQTGHLYTNELSNFYDSSSEESHEALEMESKEVEVSKNRDGYKYVGDEYLTARMTIR